MVEQAGRVDGRTADAPRWPAVGTLGVAVVSVLLTLVNPTVSAVLAVVAIALLAVLTLTFYTVDVEPPSGSGWFHGAT
jgi:Flp pilus assembly protein TadB